MKGLPGWLFAAGSALPLRLRTAARAEQQAWGSLALLRAGLLESARAAPPLKSLSGRRKRAVLPAKTAHVLAASKTLARQPNLSAFAAVVWCPSVTQLVRFHSFGADLRA